MDEEPSDSSLDLESQSSQDQVKEVKRRDDAGDDGNGQKKRKSSVENQTKSLPSKSKPEPQEGNTREKVTKEEQVKETDAEDPDQKEPTELKKETQKDVTNGTTDPKRPRMMYHITVAAMGMTIGLGHLWRLPNAAYKLKTGNFIITYAVLTLVLGLPLYFSSFASGQYSSSATFKVMSRVPIMQGVGLSMIIYAYVTTIYQMQMTGFGVHYLASSFHFDLPWTICNPLEDGTSGMRCFAQSDFLAGGEVSVKCPFGTIVADLQHLCGDDDPKYRRDFLDECCGNDRDLDFHACEKEVTHEYCVKLAAPALHFWNVTVVRPFTLEEPASGILGDRNMRPLFCSLGASLLVYGIAILGFKRAAFISIIIIPLMFVFILILLGSTFTMSGSLDGLLKFITPDVDSLTRIEVWHAAFEHTLYSLGLGMGLVISLGSFSPFNNASLKTAFAVVFTVLTANVLTACLVYTQAGVMSSARKKPFYDVFDTGLGTVFVAYSEALSHLPLPWLFSPIFFFLLTATGASAVSGLTSTISISFSEMTNFTVRDGFVLKFVIVFSSFLLGIPIIMRGGLAIVHVLDTASAVFSGPVIVGLEVISVFIYGLRYFCDDIAFMLGFNPFDLILPTFVVFPFAAAVLLVFKALSLKIDHWERWVQIIGFVCHGLIMAPILYVFLRGLFSPVKSFRHVPRVEPKSEEHKLEREEFQMMKTSV